MSEITCSYTKKDNDTDKDKLSILYMVSRVGNIVSMSQSIVSDIKLSVLLFVYVIIPLFHIFVYCLHHNLQSSVLIYLPES